MLGHWQAQIGLCLAVSTSHLLGRLLSTAQNVSHLVLPADGALVVDGVQLRLQIKVPHLVELDHAALVVQGLDILSQEEG